MEDFRVFHLDSPERDPIPPHFHGFHKIILLLKGSLSYIIEGSYCKVKPGEILLVPALSIHQPVIGKGVYERVVLWLSPEAPELKGLEEVFRIAERRKTYVFKDGNVSRLLLKLDSETGGEYGEEQLKRAFLSGVLCYAGREMKKNEPAGPAVSGRSRGDRLTDEVIRFIRGHLSEDLSEKKLAERFFVSESTLSVKFRRTVGCSVHEYVLQRRLIVAAERMKNGENAVTACQEAGFSEYSTFYRAFKKYFEMSPREFSGRKKKER